MSPMEIKYFCLLNDFYPLCCKFYFRGEVASFQLEVDPCFIFSLSRFTEFCRFSSSFLFIRDHWMVNSKQAGKGRPP